MNIHGHSEVDITHNALPFFYFFFFFYFLADCMPLRTLLPPAGQIYFHRNSPVKTLQLIGHCRPLPISWPI